jgi:hypothetical protein
MRNAIKHDQKESLTTSSKTYMANKKDKLYGLLKKLLFCKHHLSIRSFSAMGF